MPATTSSDARVARCSAPADALSTVASSPPAPATSRCSLATLCLSKARVHKAVVIGDGYPALLRARRRRERWSDSDKRFYQRHRWRSEGFHGEAKTWHGLARAVRRGLANMRIPAFLTAAAINLKRLAAALIALLSVMTWPRLAGAVRDGGHLSPKSGGQGLFDVPSTQATRRAYLAPPCEKNWVCGYRAASSHGRLLSLGGSGQEGSSGARGMLLSVIRAWRSLDAVGAVRVEPISKTELRRSAPRRPAVSPVPASLVGDDPSCWGSCLIVS